MILSSILVSNFFTKLHLIDFLCVFKTNIFEVMLDIFVPDIKEASFFISGT